MVDRITIRDIAKMKLLGEKIPMITAYDYVTARLADQVGMPSILVGDSLGMVVLGYESTAQVTLDEMLHHIKAVCRGTQHALVVGDLPFMTYQIDPSQALRNATRIVQEGGAQAVKLQKRDNRALYTKALYNQPYDNRNSYGKTYGEHRDFLEFGKNEYLELKRLSLIHI